MHPELLKVPNVLYYDEKIENGYKYKMENLFMHRDKPVLFIDCDTEEQRYGSSYTNEEEAKIVKDLVVHLSTRRGYVASKFGFVSPYQGQV